MIRPQLLRAWLLPRRAGSHKGDFGHVLVLAGSRGMTGAALLCAHGALRSGAGLVTLGVPARQRGIAAGRGRWEMMTLGLPEKGGCFSPLALGPALKFIHDRGVTQVALGCGVGVARGVAVFAQALLSSVDVPVVLDADGLNALARWGWPARRGAALVLTPHPGEAARLLKTSTPRVQADRVQAARRLALAHDAVCVLKGSRTVVTDGRRTYVNATGNPGMASGGMGDVLAGVIAGLAGQVAGGSVKERLLRAAAAGAYLHGLAGDLAAQKMGRAPLLAGDLLGFFPSAFRKTFGARR